MKGDDKNQNKSECGNDEEHKESKNFANQNGNKYIKFGRNVRA